MGVIKHLDPKDEKAKRWQLLRGVPQKPCTPWAWLAEKLRWRVQLFSRHRERWRPVWLLHTASLCCFSQTKQASESASPHPHAHTNPSLSLPCPLWICFLFSWKLLFILQLSPVTYWPGLEPRDRGQGLKSEVGNTQNSASRVIYPALPSTSADSQWWPWM